jgi:ABC-type sugar transport system substrate-binding protein
MKDIRWKSRWLIFGALLLVFVLGQEAAAGEKEFYAKKWKIGFASNNAKHPFMVAFISTIKAEAEKFPNVNLIITDGNYDAIKQNNDVEDLCSQKCDLIIIRPHQGPTAKPALYATKRAKIPMVVVERMVPVPEDHYVTYVKADAVAEGRALGQFIGKVTNGTALVAEIRGTEGTSDAQERGSGFREGIKDFQGIKIVSSQTGSYQRYVAMEAMETILQAHPKLDVVFAHNDEMALGALRAIKAAGRSGIKVVGMDGQSDAFGAIRSGEMFATLIHPLQAKEAFDVGIKFLMGKPVPKVLVADFVLIMKENVDKVKPNY